MNAQHSIASSEWYTPAPHVDAARETMGGIDLDPASCALAQTIVCATEYYDRDGLTRPWSQRLWLNPPNPPRPWWDHLMSNRGTCCFMAYSLEQLAQSARWSVPMTSFPVCILNDRVRYLTTPGSLLHAWCKRTDNGRNVSPAATAEYRRIRKALDAGQALMPGPSPTHASAVVGVNVNAERFAHAYASLGRVVLPFR